MALTPDEVARRDALQAAYDKLIKGEATASVMSGGRRVDYVKADETLLKSEIDALNARAASGRRRTRGAVTFRVS